MTSYCSSIKYRSPSLLKEWLLIPAWTITLQASRLGVTIWREIKVFILKQHPRDFKLLQLLDEALIRIDYVSLVLSELQSVLEPLLELLHDEHYHAGS